MPKRNWNFRDDELIQEMMRMWTNLDPVFDDLNEQQTRAFDMTVARDQWLTKVKQAFESKGRPVSSYNLIRKSINVINAVELMNRKKIVAKPTGRGDAKMTEIVTPVLHHYFGQGNFDWHRTKVFNNSIIAKFGVYNLGWNYNNSEIGDLDIDNGDPRTYRFEPNYADPTWEKAGFILRKHNLSFEEIMNKFALNDNEMQEAIIEEARMFFEYEPQKRDKYLSKKLKQLFSAIYEVATGSPSGNSQLIGKFLNWFDPLTGKFDVLELHEKRTERRLVVPDSMRNREIDITEHVKTDDGFRFDNQLIDQIKQRYNLTGEPRTTLADKKFVTAIVPAFRLKVNEQPYPFNIKGYIYKPQYCYDYHADVMKAQSVIDDLIDPQSAYNKAQSLKLELLWRYANNGWIMDANAIMGYEEDWESGRMAPYRRVRPGYMGFIKPEQHQVISPDLIRETQELPILMETITNTGSAMEGRESRADRSAKHFIAREQQQTKSFSYLFSNVESSALSFADAAWRIIRHFVTVPQVYRIVGENGNEYDLGVNQKQFMINEEGKIITQVLNDITAGDYDWKMSSTPYSGNAMEIEFQKFAELYNAVVELGTPTSLKRAEALQPILVEMGNFPNADKVLKLWAQIDQGSPAEQAMQQLMTKVQMILAKLGVEEKQEEVIGLKLDNELKKQELKQMSIDNVLNFKRNGSKNKQQSLYANQN